MFKFLRESKNDWYDDEVIEGLKNFLFLVAVAFGAVVFMGVRRLVAQPSLKRQKFNHEN